MEELVRLVLQVLQVLNQSLLMSFVQMQDTHPFNLLVELTQYLEVVAPILLMDATTLWVLVRHPVHL